MRQARQDSCRCTARPNSSAASILLWLFLHCIFLRSSRHHFRTIGRTEMGWCWTNIKDDSIYHVWNFPWSVCLRFGFWCQWISMYFDLQLILSDNQPIKSNSVGSGYVSHCRASSLYDHLDHCFVVFKHIQQSFLTRRIDVWGNKINIVQIIDHSMRFLSFLELCEVSNEPHFGSYTGLSVLDYSDTCFREELRRSDPINQVGVFHPTSILHPKRWFLILLNCAKPKFVSCTSQSNLLARSPAKSESRKQSQSTLLCSVSHMTILFVFICVMNVRHQAIQAFVTGFGPFCDRSCKFIHWPWSIRSSNSAKL